MTTLLLILGYIVLLILYFYLSKLLSAEGVILLDFFPLYGIAIFT